MKYLIEKGIIGFGIIYLLMSIISLGQSIFEIYIVNVLACIALLLSTKAQLEAKGVEFGPDTNLGIKLGLAKLIWLISLVFQFEMFNFALVFFEFHSNTWIIQHFAAFVVILLICIKIFKDLFSYPSFKERFRLSNPLEFYIAVVGAYFYIICCRYFGYPIVEELIFGSRSEFPTFGYSIPVVSLLSALLPFMLGLIESQRLGIVSYFERKSIVWRLKLEPFWMLSALLLSYVCYQSLFSGDAVYMLRWIEFQIPMFAMTALVLLKLGKGFIKK